MRLLGDNSKKQYEANLCHSTSYQLTEKKDSERSFRPIDPAPLTCHEPLKPTFCALFRSNWFLTITYCLVFWTFGMCVAFLGPTLGDLGCRTETPFATMSWVFFAQALFTLLGSIVGGIIVQRAMDGKSLIPGLNSKGDRNSWRTVAHMSMLLSLGVMSVTLALVPQCQTLLQLTLDMAVMGFFMGIVDTLANLCMIQLYGEYVAPFLQALHFFYALGAFTSPMINEPFLLSNSQQCFDLIDYLLTDTLHHNSTRAHIASMFQQSQVQYGFWIMSLLLVPVMAVVTATFCRSDSAPNLPDEHFELREASHSIGHQGAGKSPTVTVSSRQAALVTMCSVLVCFMYDGLQGAFGGYIYSYTTAMVPSVSSEEAAYLNSCYWGTFAIGRLLSIGIATRLSPQVMIVFNVIGCGASAIVMLMWQHEMAAIYAGTCLFGLSLSSIYPTAISLAETYIEITSLITSIIVVGAAAGEMVQPVIVGHEFSSIGPIMFIVNILLVVLCSVMIVFLLLVLGSLIKKRSVCCSSFSCCLSSSLHEDSLLMESNIRYYTQQSTQGHSAGTIGLAPTKPR